MARNISPACSAGHNKPPPGISSNNNNNNNNNKFTYISSTTKINNNNKLSSFSSRDGISPAMLKAAKSFQEKMRKKKKERKRKKQSQSEPKPLQTRSYKTQPLRKGKSYSSRSDREPRERNLEKHRERNFVFDTKIGARNFKTGFKTRNFYRLGSQKNRRRDRIWSVDYDLEDQYQ